MERNKKSRKYSNDKAITLIALIITIIIMLILVGTSISLVIKSDLIGVAKDAADRTKSKYQEEASMSQITIGNKTYDSIEDYINGEDGNWVTVYVGPVTTASGQALLVSDSYPDLVFSSSKEYKISVTSSEFTGEVQTTPIFAGTQEGVNTYLLFCVVNGEVVNYSSIEEVQLAYEANENFTMILSAYIPDTGCMIAVMSKTEGMEYTITEVKEKYEPIETKGTKIYEGTLNVEGTATLPVTIESLHKYGMIMEYEGDEHWVEVYPESFLTLTTPVGKLETQEGLGICVLSNGSILIAGENLQDLGIPFTIKAIYDMGEVGNYSEDGFEIYYNESAKQWYLIDSPSGSYEIPEKVGTAPVECVVIDKIGGTPTFTFAVDLKMAFDGTGFNECKVTVNDIEFIKNLATTVGAYSLKIDLTEIGNELVLTEEILDLGKILVVTQEVINKYPGYDNLVLE